MVAVVVHSCHTYERFRLHSVLPGSAAAMAVSHWVEVCVGSFSLPFLPVSFVSPYAYVSQVY